jgi:5-methylcytosine-specific restriction endonuclease McrA
MSRETLTDRQREYREVYLRSDHWRETRAAALERAEHKCQVCAATKRLDVHHNTYERLGQERPADLVVLCRTCHDRHHSNYNVVSLAPKKQKAKATKPRRKKAKAPGPDVHRVSEADRERFDRMREAELERRRAEKRARAERRAEVKQRRLAKAKSGRDWRAEQQLPRKDVA